MKKLLKEISKCKECAAHLPLGPRPVVAGHPTSKIVIVGQAPGSAVHASGVPWDDKSGQTLRAWMNVEKEVFYDETRIAIVPMGFCYPGRGKSGDMPPRKECAPLWHQPLLEKMKEVELILLIGKYAQDYYLQERPKRKLTDRVRDFNTYLPRYFVLPHPSPRNNIWMARNEWFALDVLPQLKESVRVILS